MKKAATAIVLLLLVLGCWPPDAGAVTVEWFWTPSATGSPATGYEFQIATDGGAWQTVATPTDTLAQVDMPQGTSLARVRAVDEFGRAGPWSPESDPFVDSGPPGACGAPAWRVLE